MPATDFDRVVGARVRSMRQAAGLSQTDLGAALGVTFQQIQKYEKGTNRLSGNGLVTMCKVLKTTPDQLLGVNKGNGAAAAAIASSLDLLENVAVRRTLEALAALPERKQEAIAKAMMVLVKAFK